jgi:hypothetical protein
MADTYSPIPELNLLKEFEDGLDDYYCGGFSLDQYGDNQFLEDPELIRRLVPFAAANGSGSLFALWKADDREDLSTLPIVVLGDEGGIHFVARDLRQFFRYLASVEPDEEIWVLDGVSYRDTEPVPYQDEYAAWLEDNFGLTPAEDPYDLMEEAESEWGERFAAWLYPLLPHEVFSPIHELNLLHAFEENPPEGFTYTDHYAQGFYLVEEGEYADPKLLKDPALVDRLIPFGTGDVGGAFALWRLDDRDDLASLPVVMVGDEGGHHLLAPNLREFLRLLGSTEGEILCDSERVFFRDGRPNRRRADYVAWLESHFGLTPASDPAAVMEAARAELGERFDTWLRAGVPNARRARGT